MQTVLTHWTNIAGSYQVIADYDIDFLCEPYLVAYLMSTSPS